MKELNEYSAIIGIRVYQDQAIVGLENKKIVFFAKDYDQAEFILAAIGQVYNIKMLDLTSDLSTYEKKNLEDYGWFVE